MKKFALVLLLLIAVKHSYAQAPFSDSLGDEIRYIFADIDTTAVSTGYLEEYGADFVSFAPFNGVLTDSNYVDRAVFRFLYGSLLTAKINAASAVALPALNVINDSAKNIQQRSGAIPIPIMLMDYNSIRPDAITQNLLQVVNGQLEDVPGRPSNPYVQHILFAAAPLKDEAKGGTANFIFPSPLFLTNKNVTISSIQADFGDGTGTHTYAFDTPFNISYSGTGAKQVSFSVTFSNDSIYKCYSELYVDYIDSTGFSRYDGGTSWHIDPYLNQAGGTVSVLYGRTSA